MVKKKVMTKDEMEVALSKLKDDLVRTDLMIENLEVTMSSIAMDYSMILSRRESSASTIEVLVSLLKKLPSTA